MQLNFTKMQGLGNDFVLLDCSKAPFSLNTRQLQFIADRKYGIGCDQILIIEAANNQTADFKYRIFNSDGSEVGHCGNGARCVIRFLYTHHKINKPSISLSIQTQLIRGYINPDDSISIDMGSPSFEPQSLPFLQAKNADNIYHLPVGAESIAFGIASVGNPHVLIRLNNITQLADTDYLSRIGQTIQNSAAFPQGVNVNFYVVINTNQIKLRTYERGCGFTLACGTGATATASYAILQQQVSNKVVVITDGGELHFAWDGIKPIIMTGPAVEVFSGQINLCK